MPKPSQRRAIQVPMRPRPMMPIVLPVISTPISEGSGHIQLFFFIVLFRETTLRAKAIIKAKQ